MFSITIFEYFAGAFSSKQAAATHFALTWFVICEIDFWRLLEGERHHYPEAVPRGGPRPRKGKWLEGVREGVVALLW